MKRLFLMVSFLFIFSANISMAQQINSNALDMLDRTSSRGNSKIWNKFIGDITDVDIPNLIDYSYAGYKNGEEEIQIIDNTIFNVVDYGAVPNDGNSDTQAIRDALFDARNGGIVFSPLVNMML